MKLVVSRTPLRTNARIHARSNAGEIDCTDVPRPSRSGSRETSRLALWACPLFNGKHKRPLPSIGLQFLDPYQDMQEDIIELTKLQDSTFPTG